MREDKISEEVQTDYQIGRDNITPFGLDIHNPVFLISGLSIVAFVIVTLMFQKEATEFFGWSPRPCCWLVASRA